MHPRNRHNSRYDLNQLTLIEPDLNPHVFINEHGDESIDFSNPDSVKLLNGALLKSFYGIKWWEIPEQYLCPPIPGRADYIHYLADLLASSNNKKIPHKIKAWDVGVGANCVYPLIGHAEYDWNFIGSEIENGAIESARKIVEANHLHLQIELRHQTDKKLIFKNLWKPNEFIDVTLCNPPFHSSAADAQKGSMRKNKNLGIKKETLNFGGKSNELWCPGGEEVFVSKMMDESIEYKKQCLWFTSLISKKENLVPLKNKLKKINAIDVRVMEMSQGQKISRALAWSFQNMDEQKNWAKTRWGNA